MRAYGKGLFFALLSAVVLGLASFVLPEKVSALIVLCIAGALVVAETFAKDAFKLVDAQIDAAAVQSGAWDEGRRAHRLHDRLVFWLCLAIIAKVCGAALAGYVLSQHPTSPIAIVTAGALVGFAVPIAIAVVLALRMLRWREFERKQQIAAHVERESLGKRMDKAKDAAPSLGRDKKLKSFAKVVDLTPPEPRKR